GCDRRVTASWSRPEGVRPRSNEARPWPAQRAYSKAGFREFGRRRQSKLMGGRLWDTIYMECLASEFTGSVFADLLAPDVPRA
ncbi:MAG: GNAT family N-acetyltransferase, partial [Chloroflexota bacterium]|nr:GNAT family N-acetyltransferase [Chloroflexota bacterium]